MEYLNLNLDKNLTLNSNTTISSQKALKSYIDAKRINLDFLQASAPSEFSTGDKWLNTTDKKVYTATSSSTWDSGVSLTDGQIYSFENLLYHYDGTNILIYSTETITEQNNRNEIKSWFGTQNEYDALSEIDDNTTYYIVDNASVVSTLLATQQEFNNSVQNKAATPYQVNQALGNYLPLAGGNLDANAVLRLTNSNNGTVTLAYNTNNYLTVSSNLSVSGTTSTNSLIATSGNIYNGSVTGPKVIWNNNYATSSTAGIVKPDNTTTSVDANGIISVIGGGSGGGSVILLQFLQSTTPTTYSTDNKWLNTSDYKLYTATSSSAWDSGTTITEDQIFGFNNLLYHYNGTSLEIYSTESIKEQNVGNETKLWVGTQDEYDTITTYDTNTIYNIVDSETSLANQYHPPLFKFEWDDKLRNNLSWLRADTFSWHNGGTYSAAYSHLLNDIPNKTTYYRWVSSDISDENYYYTQNASPSFGSVLYTESGDDAIFFSTIIVSGSSSITDSNNIVYTRDGTATKQLRTTRTQTISGVSVRYYQATDGHKIVLPDQEQNVLNLYNTTGVAWYYILDTANQRFKLPRTKWGFTGLRNSVGSYVTPGLPNVAGILGPSRTLHTASGTVINTTTPFIKTATSGTNTIGTSGDNTDVYTYGIDLSTSNSIYGNSTTVQPPATQMYLYFYVGNYTETAIEQTAGLNTELFNNKADTNLSNVLANIDYVVDSKIPTAQDPTWYRVWRKGWVEQGGRYTLTNQGGQGETITLPKEMADTNYIVLCGPVSNTGNWPIAWCPLQYRTTTTINLDGTGNYTGADRTITIEWEVKGQGV